MTSAKSYCVSRALLVQLLCLCMLYCCVSCVLHVPTNCELVLKRTCIQGRIFTSSHMKMFVSSMIISMDIFFSVIFEKKTHVTKSPGQ